ncbi:MAG TPA: ABC transporter substrate-binding protein [Acidimicrobiales bacterium]|jgi:osmoprotectant transport system substrate-binding protein|nr:ABC transporter substrate-binding protein [Acidimicrobiales bacterium]
MTRPFPVKSRTVGTVAVLAAFVLGACGSGKSSTSTAAGKSLVIGSAPFPESEIVANMYAGALQADGYQVTVRSGLGQREIYLPALEQGGKNNGIDLVPEYVGTLLEYVNKGAGEASGDLDATATKLRARLDPMGLTALTPSPAADQNAFAVTKATADKDKLKKLSDLVPYASNMTLGAGPECPTRPFCQPGLEKTYGLKFKTFRVLDSGGPKTIDALVAGDIDVGLVFSSDGSVAAKNLVVLDDDKKLQTVDNIVPAIRKDVVDDTIRKDLDKVSAALNTPDLIQLNKQASVDKADPDVLAKAWLQQHGFTKK